MKCKILEKASEMFLSLGFKSVTMDDISGELGVSKKTIYSHFRTKNKLVEETTFYVFNKVCNGIDAICNKKHNSIKELFEIKEFVFSNLKDEKSSPQYQLQKFFPEIHEKMKKKHFGVMKKCVDENLSRGIKDGLFRPSLDKDFITRIYFTGINGLKDQNIFPDNQFKRKELMSNYLEYHVRAIATQKGLETLNQILNNNNIN